MKKKLTVLGFAILIAAAGLFYIQNNNLLADDKTKKDCSSECTKNASTELKTGCGNELKAGSINDDKDLAEFEFTTDKVTCNGTKSEMQSSVLKIAGVKNVNFGSTCSESKMTKVKVYYSPVETTPEIISASVKEQKMDCSSSCTGKTKSSGVEKQDCGTKKNKGSNL
jgi:hypothetical protein